MVFTNLKHRKWLLGVYQTDNVFYELATQKIFFDCLRHGKWFSPACHVGNNFYGLATQKLVSGLATQKMDFKDLPPGKISKCIEHVVLFESDFANVKT